MDKKTKIAIEIFNSRAKEYDQKFASQALYLSSFQLFISHLSKAEADILEVGCGPGNVTKSILSEQAKLNYLGTDLAPQMLTLARVNNPSASFEKLDCRDITLLKKKFDGIVSAFCFPYINIEAVSLFILDSFELLNDNGVLYISTMEGSYESSDYKPSSSGKGPMAFIHYYSQDFLTRELEKAGFILLYNQVQEYPDATPSSTQDLIIIAQKP